MPSAIIPMADYGNDPTEVATPFSVFKSAGFSVAIATENGAVPQCDKKMLDGWTGKLLGAAKPARDDHTQLLASSELQNPLSWSDPSFSLNRYDLVFLPGGHEKGMAQYITSASLHTQLATFVPQTARESPSKKTLAAICHGVQVLAETKTGDDSKSVLHDKTTTALPSFFEISIWHATRVFLGNYYRTFGASADSVEAAVRKQLDEPEKQWKGSHGGKPFVVQDEKYNYLSARFPPDAEELAKKAVARVNQVVGAG